MHPEDFARAQPRRYLLPDEWGELQGRYACLGSSAPLDWVYKHVRSQGATSALREHEYLDRDYRDEYRQFYAQTFRWLPDRCERLHFWADDRYLGYCSVRPVNGRPVGRTMLDPGPDYEHDVACVVSASATPYGRALSTPAFPFMSQDGQYGRCAHAAIWMIARYHHLRFRVPQCFMSDIVSFASELETERVWPSRGLTDDQAGMTFRKLGLDALQYTVTDGGDVMKDREDVEALLRRYLNSAIPLALGTPNHLIAVIGGGYDENGELTIIQCDDQHGVYDRRPIDLDTSSDGCWQILMVPLPGRIYVPFEHIEDEVRRKINQLVYDRELDQQLAGRRLRYREYVVEVTEYKRRLVERRVPSAAARSHALVPSARWLWVYEIQDADVAEESPDCVLGEIAIDATSDGEGDMVLLFANILGLRAVWPRNAEDPVVAVVDLDGDEVPYRTGTALNL